jgi:hypothetical protein
LRKSTAPILKELCQRTIAFCRERIADGLLDLGLVRSYSVIYSVALSDLPRGHSHEDANRILEAHDFKLDLQIAWNAIRKLEAIRTGCCADRGAKREI